MSILIVDDSFHIRTQLQFFLKSGGYTDLLFAENPLEAFKYLGLDETAEGVEGIELILMDALMPNIDGFEACHIIKSSDPLKDIPIIMVTGMSDQEDLESAFAAGVNDYIIKPLKKTELLARVRSLLKLKQEMDKRKAQEAELRKLNEELEKRVLERTAKLNMAIKDAEQFARKAEAANEAKSQFLANVSHEIRTPMNGVLGMTTLLLETQLNKEQREFAETIYSSADSLLSVINDILDFSKQEAGKLILQPGDFNLNIMLENVVRILNVRAKKKKLNFTCVTQDPLPLLVHGDKDRLMQVIKIIGDNAIKFTEKGGVTVEVGIKQIVVKTMTLHVKITDTGIGIPTDRMNLLFKPFSQIDGSSTRKYEGTGLGLMISKELVEMMHGQIGLESQEGKGTEVWFTADLTLQENATANDIIQKGVFFPKGETSSSPPNQTACVYDDQIRILLVEDNLVNRKLALKFLQKKGYHADAAENGQKAVEVLSKIAYSLVLMDVQMPVMDGFEATRIIRDPNSSVCRKDVPIISMTAHAIPGYREKCIQSGMNDYISKPVDPNELYAILEKYLGPPFVRLDDENAAASSSKIPPKATFDSGKVGAVARTLKEGLSINDPIKTRDHFTELKALLATPPAVQDRLVTLEDQVWNYEFDEALNSLDELMRSLEISWQA